MVLKLVISKIEKIGCVCHFSKMLHFFTALSASANVNASCNVVNGELKITDGIDKSAAAYAIYDGDINSTGWYQLHVIGNEKADPIDMMRCSGAVEGYLAHKDIYNHFKLICDIKGFPRDAATDNDRYTKQFQNFMKTGYRFIEQSIEAYPESLYWRQVSYLFAQIKGMVEGYDMAEGHGRMSLLDHWVLQSEGDLGDIGHYLDRVKETSQSAGPMATLNEIKPGDPEEMGDHCSGLIRILDDYSDIYFAHDAWSDYRDLHGVLKEYYFPIKEFKAHRLSLSTRPGKISSYDDFYLADSGLMVLETTMSIFNMSLYDYVKPASMSTWFRATLAMWTTNKGEEWVDTFMKNNMGTYNNQYVVVDTNLFTRGKRPGKDFMWVVEQVPGPFWQKEDVTEQVLSMGYWPSINKPHSKYLYNLMGYPERIKELPHMRLFYLYEGSARYNLMAREAPYINDYEKFKSFMRYNNWRRDVYSNGDASQQIMSRYDLRRDGDPYGASKAFGGLDTKAARYTDYATKMMFDAIASPANEHGNPNWDFNGKFKVTHDGLPDVWNFSWIKFRSEGYDACDLAKDDCMKAELCGYCIYHSKCLPGDKSGPFEQDACPAGWEKESPMPKWATPVISAVTVIVVAFCGFVLFCHIVGKKKYSTL